MKKADLGCYNLKFQDFIVRYFHATAMVLLTVNECTMIDRFRESGTVLTITDSESPAR